MPVSNETRVRSYGFWKILTSVLPASGKLAPSPFKGEGWGEGETLAAFARFPLSPRAVLRTAEISSAEKSKMDIK